MDGSIAGNSWLVQHLRQLADKIQNENPRVINIGLRTDCQYKCPKLYIEVYEKMPPVRKCQDCGVEYRSHERCPECFSMG